MTTISELRHLNGTYQYWTTEYPPPPVLMSPVITEFIAVDYFVDQVYPPAADKKFNLRTLFDPINGEALAIYLEDLLW